jgi:hypothetical protein
MQTFWDKMGVEEQRGENGEVVRKKIEVGCSGL